MEARKIITAGMALFLALLFLISCKEDKIDVYDGETNIYFSLKRWGSGQNGFTYAINDFVVGDSAYSESWNTIRQAQDSIVVSMALDGTDVGERVALVPVSISGNVTDYDREIAFSLDRGITTAEPDTDFKAEGFIPAGKRTGAIAVRLNRMSFRDTTMTIGFQLIPNNHFQTNYRIINRSSSDTSKVDLQSFRLIATSVLTPPPEWNSLMVYYFGTFSRKKVFLILELTGGNIEELYVKSPTIPLVIAWGKVLKKYLLEQKNKGNTLYEDDGVTEMTAGSLI